MSRLAMVFLISALGAGSGSASPQHADSNQTRLENELASVKLGSTVAELQKRFPTLYRHRLAMGEMLYEACDQKELVVFNFTAEPWSPEFITYIDVRREEDVTVCRDATGSLPDLGLPKTTPRGVAIGDAVEVVLSKYGAPDEDITARNGDRVLRYRTPEAEFRPPIRKPMLVFIARAGRVRSFSVFGNIPGAKTPFEKQ